MAVKLNQPVRTADGEVTTIAKLHDEGRVRFEKSDKWRGRNGTRTIYRAVMVDAPDLFWEVSKLAYESRTGGKIELSCAGTAGESRPAGCQVDGPVTDLLAATLAGDQKARGQLLDAMKESGHELAAEKLCRLLGLPDALSCCLWPEGNSNHQWSADTLDEVAEVLIRAGFCPNTEMG